MVRPLVYYSHKLLLCQKTRARRGRGIFIQRKLTQQSTRARHRLRPKDLRVRARSGGVRGMCATGLA